MDPQRKKDTQRSNPLKSASRFLTLEYGFAIAATLVSLIASVATVTKLMTMWTTSKGNGSVLSLVSSIKGVDYVQVITVALAAALLGLVAWVLFGRVTRAVAGPRAEYTKRVSYQVVTYSGFAILIVMLTGMTVSLLGILLSSLVLIGADAGIGDLYLKQFVPQFIALVIVGVAAWLYYRIVIGRNVSRVLSLGLAGLGVAVLVAAIITSAVQSHQQSEPRQRDRNSTIERTQPRNDSMRDSQDLMRDFNRMGL